MENKQIILNALLVALQLTRAGDDLHCLRYDAEDEEVKVFFTGGSYQVINVALDSGLAMLRDVLNQIDIG